MSVLNLINEVVKSNEAKCGYCKKPFDKKSRFVELMESSESDYRKILVQYDFCSDECVKNG